MAKIAVAGVWLVGLVALLLLEPDSRAAGAARLLIGLLVGAHLLECLVFLPRLRRAGGSLPAHLVQTFAFGIFHVREIDAAGANASE